VLFKSIHLLEQFCCVHALKGEQNIKMFNFRVVLLMDGH